MPPKRKRATESEASATPAATTRRSTRKNAVQVVDIQDEVEATNGKPPKKPRNTKKSKASEQSAEAPQPRVDKKTNELDPRSCTPARISALFSKYADEDDANLISTEGIEKLCGDAELSMEGPCPFLFAWLLKAKNFGAFSREEWESGLGPLRIDTAAKIGVAVKDLENLFFSPSGTGAQTFCNPAVDPYDRKEFSKYASNPPASFKAFYLYCFNLAKKEEQRVIEMEMATAMWSVLLQPKFPIIEKFIQFIGEHPNYKAANKDVWNMTLEFCFTMQTVDFATYSDSESWPSILDEFVAWQKKQLSEDHPMSM